jgi:Fuc2NAc and GlcNAc transferase
MGDAGSYFLGYMFALLALAAERMGHIPALVFAILLAVFICDATWTLAMRVRRRARLDQGHREHAYQRLLDLGISHRRLAVSVAAINVLLLWPAALLADRKRSLLVPVVILIYFVLSVLWWLIRIVASRRTMRSVEKR